MRGVTPHMFETFGSSLHFLIETKHVYSVTVQDIAMLAAINKRSSSYNAISDERHETCSEFNRIHRNGRTPLQDRHGKRKIMRAIMHVNIHAWPIAITGDLDVARSLTSPTRRLQAALTSTS